MNRIVDQALSAWGFDGAEARLVATRENQVYAIESGAERYALRLHRKDYRSDAELNSELAWMGAAAKAGISVPAPLPASNGDMLCHCDGVQVDVLTWLNGVPLTETLNTATDGRCGDLFFALGREMARLHRASDDWTPPSDFTRVHWNHDGLLSDAPIWDRFWENPTLTNAERELFTEFRQRASEALRAMEDQLDYGLIHADLVPDNVLVDGDALHLIDFDDGGYGFRLFDIATALLKHRSRADYPVLKERLIAGYLSERQLDLSALDLFMALRAATYVGWIVTRLDEPGGAERNTRFIATLKELAAHWLSAH